MVTYSHVAFLAELWLSGFNERQPVDPEEVIILHQAMKVNATDEATQAYHQLMIDRLTWLHEMEFFQQLKEIETAMKKNRAKAGGSREHAYTAASDASLQLCHTLLGAKEFFLQAESSSSLQEQKENLLTTCQSAIRAADGVLSVHRVERYFRHSM